MTDGTPARYAYQHDLDTLRNGMVLAGQNLRLGAVRGGLMALISVVSFVLIAAGGGVTGVALALVAGMTSDTASVFAVLGGGLGAAFGIGWYNRLVRLMAKAVTETPFNQGQQELCFDANGVTLRNAQAEWRTDWAAVHGLKAEKSGLHFFISGIVLSLPATAVGTADDVQALFERLETWRSAATGQ